jgi:hypothetical protein
MTLNEINKMNAIRPQKKLNRIKYMLNKFFGDNI